MDRILSSFAVHSANSSSVLEVRQHLGSSFGWSLTGGTARARTEVAPTASPLRHAVPASTANQGHSKPETISMDVLVGHVYPIGRFVEELAATKQRALLPGPRSRCAGRKTHACEVGGGLIRLKNKP